MKYIKWSSSFAVLWVLVETNAETIGLPSLKKQAKINDGRPQDIREVPFMVALSLHSFMCGGFLIDSLHVVTAYHCLIQIFNSVDSKQHMKMLTVTVAARNKRNPKIFTQKDLDVENVIPHPNYNSKGHFNDIAIIKLKPDHDWEDWQFSYVKLPDMVRSPLKERKAFAFGWGREYPSSPRCAGNIADYRHISSVHDISVINEVELPIIDSGSCKRKLDAALPCAFEIKKTQLCAGGVPKKDTCKGDSGGPLIQYESENKNPVAIGIVSYGYGCGSGLPAVYTKVSQYTRWIRQVTNS